MKLVFWRKVAWWFLFVIFILFGISRLTKTIQQIGNDPEVGYYISNPELTYQIFSDCKKNATHVDKCYSAYSAAVRMAESEDCSHHGVKLKRRFKLLVEHSKPEGIEKEIVRECNGGGKN
ncbi:hypothetical protein [Serratia ureilytica]|uniref:hypothetical protein n=1 Tax=Serratia ureilytica TaxID=300181 RepID=UPI001D184D42|nr:hypothetical protein [Serratia ureilytica]MCC4108685.1 hypothetical protein [Serratia ureilytica]